MRATRPRTPIGTFGDIEFTTLGPERIRARTRVRDFDGKVRRVEATAATRKIAEHRLKEKLAQRAAHGTCGRQLTPDSSFKDLVRSGWPTWTWKAIWQTAPEHCTSETCVSW